MRPDRFARARALPYAPVVGEGVHQQQAPPGGVVRARLAESGISGWQESETSSTKVPSSGAP
ncbi:hypothetical protein [Streptomyces axinellae]|uniref:Uncharacterized protein n=1 Tax=Streptomyces axinellae TaxID=552788 RepID=A0ABP6C673_9ACTN